MRPTGRTSTATSTPTGPIDRGWPRCTSAPRHRRRPRPVARALPASGVARRASHSGSTRARPARGGDPHPRPDGRRQALGEGPSAVRPMICSRSPPRNPVPRSRCWSRRATNCTRTRRRCASRRSIAGQGLDVRGPNQSRLDLVAAAPGVVTVRIAELERINRLDPLEVFTVYDGQVVEKGDLVASVKIAPHLVDAGVIEAGARIAGFGSQPIVSVEPFVARRVGVVVKESVRATGPRAVRGIGPSQDRGAGLGDHRYRVRPRRCRRGRDRARSVHAWCGDRGPDPDGGFCVDRPRGRVLRRDRAPSAVVSSAAVCRRIQARCCGSRGSAGRRSSGCRRVGRTRRRPLRTCCYRGSWRASRPSEATVAKLGHGGILTRDQRFRFPRYARELDAPEG